MKHLKLYQARLQTRVASVMAFNLTDARLCLQELYPNESIFSILLAPEWASDAESPTPYE